MRQHSTFLLRILARAVLLMLIGSTTPPWATNLTGTFRHPDGSLVNGKLVFLLSQPGRLNDSSAQIVPMVKIFTVSNGALEANAFVYGNDVLVPTGTFYLVRLVDGSNNLLFEQKWSILGANLDLGTPAVNLFGDAGETNPGNVVFENTVFLNRGCVPPPEGVGAPAASSS